MTILYLVAYWLPALGSGSPNPTGGVAARTEGRSSALSDFFAAHTAIFAAVLAAMLALGAVLSLYRRLAGRELDTTEGTIR